MTSELEPNQKVEIAHVLSMGLHRRSAELQYVIIRPQVEHLRSDPRVADLIRRMGLSP